MKKFIHCSFILFICLFAVNGLAQNDTDTSSLTPYDVLDISGEITHGEASLEGVLVELYEGNRVVDAFETKKNGKFKFTLMSAEIYTIQLTKKGYYTKRISVNTNIPAEIEDTYKFDFDINVDAKEEKSYDSYLVEYPSALIAYDKKKDEFVFDKTYTKSYFEEIEASAD